MAKGVISLDTYMMKLSVVVLTLNEEKVLEECLQSIKWVDELIIIDSGSIDKTLEIARKYTKKIFRRKLDSFAKQRNFGFRKTKGEWILYIDADERVSKNLRREIQITIKENKYSAYRMARENYFFGKRVRYGGYWPDYVTRLFERRNFKKWTGEIHESPEFQGELGELKKPLIHFSHRSLEASLQKSIRWTKMEAGLFYKVNHPPVSWWRLFRVFLSEFLRRLVKLQGFRDGMVGLIEAWMQGFNRLLVYIYLWEMQQQESQE